MEIRPVGIRSERISSGSAIRTAWIAAVEATEARQKGTVISKGPMTAEPRRRRPTHTVEDEEFLRRFAFPEEERWLLTSAPWRGE